MTQNQSKYRLLRGSGASPVFQKIQKAHQADDNIEANVEDTDLLLASGFSSVSPDLPFTLSAALQLNGDLAMFDDDQLRCFAEAELRRKKQAIFKSYTIDPDNHVCVLSDTAVQLDSFIDVYGGILQVDSLLLKNSNPNYDSVTDLSITWNKDNYKIEFSVRSPVDLSKCNYCGECGPSCPENCISETLFFDYSTCTYCRDCEKACPQKAIDIHAIEKRDMVVPAIIVLDGTKVDLPEQNDSIFQEKNITNYLATLFPCQVEEVIVCDHTICQNSKNGKAGCTKCIDSCPTESITGAESIQIDALSCIECGNCAGICPTGAIQYQRFPDESFLEFFRDFPMAQNSTVVLGTEKDLHRFWWKRQQHNFSGHVFLEYPNLNAISLFHLIFLIAHGANQVIILHNNPKDSLLTKTTTDANRLIEMLFGTLLKISICSIDDYPETNQQGASSPLFEKTYRKLKYINRRQKISSILQFFQIQSGKTIEFKRNEIADFATINCDENKCTQCLACLNECKIQSLTADPAALKLSWTGSVCIGCGSCITTCPENALSFNTMTRIDPDYFLPATIAQAEPMRCKECGKTFGTKKSFEHVMKILATKDMDKDGFFEYCEDCRVMKLSESE